MTVSNKSTAITDQDPSASTVSNKSVALTDQDPSASTVSNKLGDEVGAAIIAAGNTRQAVTGKSYTEPSGIQYQVDNANQGVRRQRTNFISSDPPNPFVTQGSAAPEVSFFLADGTGSIRDFPEVGLLQRTTGVDLTAAGSVPLLTVPGRQVVVLGCSVRITSSSVATVEATAGVGFNGAADNIFGSQVLTGLLSVGEVYEFPPGGTQGLASPPSDTISFGIDLGATATILIAEILLFGYVRRS